MQYKLNGKVVTKAEWDARGSRLQEILESRKFPGIQTEDTFKAGFGGKPGQWEPSDPVIANAGIAEIKKRIPGWSPQGKVHIGGLGPMNDHRAWVSEMSARSEARRYLEETGRSCDGMVKVQAREVAAPVDQERVRSARIEQVARERAAMNPGMKLDDARDAAARQLTPPKQETPDIRDVRAALDRLAKDSGVGK